MITKDYSINFLLIEPSDSKINQIYGYINKFNITINLFTANNQDDLEKVIANNEIDYIFISEKTKVDLAKLFVLLGAENQANCIILLQSLDDQPFAKLTKANIIIAQDLDFELFKRLIGYSLINSDVLISSSDKLKKLYNNNFVTTHDSLTMLQNREFLYDKIEHAIAHLTANNQLRAPQQKHYMAVFFIDLDGFKNVNDTAGHSAGDIILKEVAKRLVNNTRISDIVCRYGGDEFVVFLPSLRHKNDAEIVAEKVLNVLAEPFLTTANGFTESWSVTASIGVSIYPDDATEPKELIDQADRAMYIAKQEGKNTIRYYNSSISKALEKKYSIIADIRESIVNNNFYFDLQPIHDLKSQAVTGVELFVRWQHPTKGLIMPNDFIPFLVNTGYINSLGELIVKKALGVYYELSKHNIKLNITMNAEARQFINDNFIERIASLRSLGIDIKSLTVEITEDCFKTNFEIINNRLNRLKELGVALSLDNFGMGNSSITQLMDLPVDYIKIDNKILCEQTYKKGEKNIYKGIIAMAHGFDKKIIAKRIDDADQLEKLASMGCDYGQGYCYTKPLSIEKFIEYIKQKVNV